AGRSDPDRAPGTTCRSGGNRSRRREEASVAGDGFSGRAAGAGGPVRSGPAAGSRRLPEQLAAGREHPLDRLLKTAPYDRAGGIGVPATAELRGETIDVQATLAPEGELGPVPLDLLEQDRYHDTVDRQQIV